MKHEELEFLSEMKSTESLKTSKKSPVNEDKPTDSDNDPPVAVSALKKIWDYIKQACSEKSLRDSLRGSTGSIDGTMKPSVLKLKRDRKISKGSLEAKIKLRKEKLRECQKRAGAFLLDLEEKGDFGDISQCEVCAVRFFNKGKSKKSFFGLSSLCENCSDRQLKLLRQTSHAGASKNSEPETFNSNCSLETQPHLMLLDNALFLLNMINTLPDRCEIMDAKTARSTLLLPVMKGFNSFEALGYSEIKVENEQEFGQADDEVNVSPNQFNFLETDDLTAEEKIALEDILSYPNSSFIVHTEADPTQNLRRRKTSNEEQNQSDSEGGFNLVNKPSPALQKFLDLTASSTDDEALTKLCGNVISFVSEKYDLKLLKVYLFLTIRKVTCRSYGLQMLTWLLRTVSQPTCLHDIFWWYASTFELRTDQREIKPEDGDNGWWQLRVHPLTDSPAAIFPVLVDSFYLLLETISGIMEYLPIGSPLLEMAVKTWGVSFFRKDHKFLQKCQIFQNLSKILSQFDGENEWSKSSTSAEFQERDPEDTGEITICYEDLTPTAEIKVSSRPALTSSLNDESTDTFWESGEEDRNRAKSIIIVTDNDSVIKTVGLYIDNVKDTNHRVTLVSARIGPRIDEFSPIGGYELEAKSVGWIWFNVDSETAKVARLDLKGAENSIRIRQVKVLGYLPNRADDPYDKPSNFLIARRKCENETLRIFRLLSSEVFGKLLNQVKNSEDDEGNDLQEHVVGILFSRNKLSHLQKQVCSHIVSAIHREAMKIKEDFESQLSGIMLEASLDNVKFVGADKPKIPDRYCFEMLSLVLALAGSKVGRSYLSQQSNLVQDLIQLLHSGTPRIQRQVTQILRKILPEIKPLDFERIVRCYTHSVAGDAEPQVGVLDLLLGVIAKGLQVKARSTATTGRSRTAKELSISDAFTKDELATSPYWFLYGEIEPTLANTVVRLIKDLTEGAFLRDWESVSKEAIAEAILYIPTIPLANRNLESCLLNHKFWIALAAVCVLHPSHAEQLSYPVYQHGLSGRPMCSNHDDGETPAVIQCTVCSDLCAECDRYLHLPKKNWSHSRKVCKEEEEAIKVDLHEGCGRIKLFWLMALADSSTLKTLVEFRNGIPRTNAEFKDAPVPSVGKCRFCSKSGNTGALALGNICGDSDCQEFARTACDRILACGHLCGGVKDEVNCMPCLYGCTLDREKLKQDGEDMCMICFTDALAFAPSAQLECGHVFHYHCCRAVLSRRWAGPRITFTFSTCPMCKVDIKHDLLSDLLTPIHELYEDIKSKSLMRLEYEGMSQAEAISSPGSQYYKNPGAFAMERYAYYLCYKCNKPYFGGDARCDVEIQLDFDPEELVCGACSDVAQAQLCPKHGTDYLEYKCRYCCSVAVFFCFGTTHFCNGCHDDFQRVTTIPKHLLPHCPVGSRAKQLDVEECPLHLTHPPTGEEFALGCGICRNAHTF